MSINRRRFLENAALTLAASKIMPRVWGSTSQKSPASASASNHKKAYGSGYFGEWTHDEFGLPAFHYTCDQLKDPKAVTEVNPGILAATEHIHQVGNDRIVAIASNYGHIRVRQDEGAPKFLNDFAPERGCFAGGFGYLTDGTAVLSTFYPGNADSFDRVFGIGYFRKKVSGHGYAIDQVIFAPFGDDPVLVSQVTISNARPSAYLGCWVAGRLCQLAGCQFVKAGLCDIRDASVVDPPASKYVVLGLHHADNQSLAGAGLKRHQPGNLVRQSRLE